MDNKYPPLQYIGFELEELHDEGVIYETRWRVWIQRGGIMKEHIIHQPRLIQMLMNLYPQLERYTTYGWRNPDQEAKATVADADGNLFVMNAGAQRMLNYLAAACGFRNPVPVRGKLPASELAMVTHNVDKRCVLAWTNPNRPGYAAVLLEDSTVLDGVFYLHEDGTCSVA